MEFHHDACNRMANMRTGKEFTFKFGRPLAKIVVAAGLAVATLLAAAGGANAQQSFKSPEEAVDTLVAAVRADDPSRVIAILGAGGRDIVASGDSVADQNSRKEFLAAYDAKKAIERKDEGATLVVGAGNWPFPIPLRKEGDSWRFDTAAGRLEILYRRIGRNELNAAQVAFAYVEAQNDYAAFAKKEFGKAEYAQRITSVGGKKNGLYWESDSGDSPLGELFARAADAGYAAGARRIPYQGYYYKILKRQGPQAPGGTVDYVVRGKMTEGFALVAWPAEYGNSGVKTFAINQLGILYEKDLGRDTARIASRMAYFNPDQTWERSTAGD